MPIVTRSLRHHRRRRLALTAVALPGAALLVAWSSGAAGAATGANPVSVGLPPTAVVIDHQAHTAYVAVTDGVSSQIAVVDTARCKPVASTSCPGAVAAVHLPYGAAPSALALDAKNHTVYVADAENGGVEMINAATCSAAHKAGCAATPKRVGLGLTAPSAVAVDTSRHGDAVYVADSGDQHVLIFSGVACNATKTGGCAKTRRVWVGGAPVAIAVDPAADTVYVANVSGDSVSTLNRTVCSTLRASCAAHPHAVRLGGGTAPEALLVDNSEHTLYVADSGTNAVSVLDTATCNSIKRKTCGKTPHRLTGFGSADGLALAAAGRVAVAAGAGDAVIVFRAASCNASSRSGCTHRTTHNLSGAPVGIAASGGTAYAADSTMSSLDVLAVS